MTLLVLAALLACVFLSAYLLVDAATTRRAVVPDKAEAPVADVPPGAPAFVKVFYPLITLLSGATALIGWPNYRERAAVDIKRSGWGGDFTVDHLLALKFLIATFGALFLALLFAVLRNPAMFLVVAAVLFFVPDRLLRGSRQAREREIIRALPGAVDVLSLSVEAGLEFLIALERLVKRGLSGPLRDELTVVLNEIRMGTTRSDALRNMATRLEIPQVSSFVSTLVQADLLGASIGDVLKMQAEFLRTERFQRAEKAGGQATQKIIFPMLLFIFPAVLIIVIAPVVLKFIYQDY